MPWDCSIVGLLVLELFECWVIIVGISLAKVTMATTAYCGIVFYCLCLMVTMENKLFIVINLVKLS
jgi:hypothetical protein